MPRYFFNTRIGQSYMPDPDGVELRDADQAWVAARATVLQLLMKERETPSLVGAVLEVTDAEGEIVLEFPFSEALIDLPPATPSRH